MHRNMKTFKYIVEEALQKFGSRGNCYWCNQDSKLYRIFIEDEESGKQSDQACIKCIKTLPLKWFDPKDDERKISTLINKKYPKGTKSQDQRFALTVETCDEYRRTPQLQTFLQGVDWPDCCGDFTEFVDLAEQYEGNLEKFIWWGEENHFAKEQGLPKAMENEDSCMLYQCLTCEQSYWTIQCT